MLKLGTDIIDIMTGLSGQLTHMQMASNGDVYYNFQPKGLNPETSQPLKHMWITEDRIRNGIVIDDADMPTSMLSTVVEDKASGFIGRVIALTLHINGCVHALIQAPGLQPKTGEVIDSVDVDIRRLSGEFVPKFESEEAKEKDKKKRPSPAPMGQGQPTMMKLHIPGPGRPYDWRD